jgi:hypothetical protein
VSRYWARRLLVAIILPGATSVTALTSPLATLHSVGSSAARPGLKVDRHPSARGLRTRSRAYFVPPSSSSSCQGQKSLSPQRRCLLTLRSGLGRWRLRYSKTMAARSRR